MKIALPALALAGAVAAFSYVWGVVVILTGFAASAVHLVFYAVLVPDLYDSSDEVSDSEEEDLKIPAKPPSISIEELEAVIGPIDQFPELEINCSYDEFIYSIKTGDMKAPIMRGVFKGKAFIVFKFDVKGYYYKLDVSKETLSYLIDTTQDPHVDTSHIEMIQEVAPGQRKWMVTSQVMPQVLSALAWSAPFLRTETFADKEALLDNIAALLKEKCARIRSGGLIYFYSLSSDSSLRVV
jgi:hypothetical protein